MNEFNIWEGVYDHFDNAPECGTGFNSDRWIKGSEEKLSALLSDLQDGHIVPGGVSYSTNLLPFLVSLRLDHAEKQRILDFGGGIGLTYAQTISAIKDCSKLEYHIIENEKMCEAGRQAFSGDHRVHFHSSLPTDPDNVNIVHISSSLQYVRSWQELLEKLAGYRPSHFLFIDLPAGDISTFATIQNYYESKIPHWFFNIHDIVDVMSKLGYSLQFKSSFSGIFLGKPQDMPLQNFDAEHRLKKACNLLFTRAIAD